MWSKKVFPIHVINKDKKLKSYTEKLVQSLQNFICGGYYNETWQNRILWKPNKFQSPEEIPLHLMII